jgi:hypothetical protein
MTTYVLEYEPRKQFVPFHNRSQRFSSLVCHRRAGKTVACVNDLVAKALHTSKKNARYAYIAPFYRQAKDVAWTYLKEAVGELATKVREADLRIELPNGAWITLYGADNPDALRGLYFDGVILDEFGDCRPALWAEVVLPTLLDRKGWAVFIGTPKGKNHFHTMNERAKQEDSWYQLTMKASESGIISQEDLEEIRRQMTEDQYNQEMECSFEAAVLGTYYASTIALMENQGKMGDVPYDPDYPVSAASDLGFTDSTAWWFWQTTPTGINIIDYEEHSGEHVDFYVDMLKGKSYRYDNIWLPHDAKAKTVATKRSTIEQFTDAFTNTDTNVYIVPKLALQHGIDAARKILPQCRFDKVACYDGIEALRAYRRQYNEVAKQFSKTPVHDWASNGADAYRYFSLVTLEQLRPEQNEATVQQPLIKPAEYTLNQLFKDNENGRGWSSGIIRI